MISFRHADLLNRMKTQHRDKILMVIAIYPSPPTEDNISIWFYDDKRNQIEISEYNKILGEKIGYSISEYGRSWHVDFPQLLFSPKLPAFTKHSKDGLRKHDLFHNTMGDIYKQIQANCKYYVGTAEFNFNEAGTCFGVIELFKPKFEVGQYANFKDDDGNKQNGLIIGLDCTDGVYVIQHEHKDYEIQEKEMMLGSMI